MTSPCLTCGQEVDEIAFSYGRCIGCRREYMAMKSLRMKACGRNGKAKAGSSKKLNSAQRLWLIGGGVHSRKMYPSVDRVGKRPIEYNRKMTRLIHVHTSWLSPQAAMDEVQKNLPDYEDLPLDTRR
jgi:hypothetical protein